MIGVPTQVNVHEAKTHLSRLLSRVQAGEEIIIARAGRPVARLVPFRHRPAKRVAGTAKGKVKISADFDAPLPDALLVLITPALHVNTLPHHHRDPFDRILVAQA
jgi:prevent-host-death family protein